jgi:hypothetical protein
MVEKGNVRFRNFNERIRKSKVRLFTASARFRTPVAQYAHPDDTSGKAV